MKWAVITILMVLLLALGCSTVREGQIVSKFDFEGRMVKVRAEGSNDATLFSGYYFLLNPCPENPTDKVECWFQIVRVAERVWTDAELGDWVSY